MSSTESIFDKQNMNKEMLNQNSDNSLHKISVEQPDSKIVELNG